MAGEDAEDVERSRRRESCETKSEVVSTVMLLSRDIPLIYRAGAYLNALAKLHCCHWQRFSLETAKRLRKFPDGKARGFPQFGAAIESECRWRHSR